MNYAAFLDKKTHLADCGGFDPLWMHPKMFDFQVALAEWAIKRGRAAIFADCGLGKTLIQLVWAQNMVMKTNGRVLIMTPLAVGSQTMREAEIFGIDCHRSKDGHYPPSASIVVTNYERLHYFNPQDFIGAVCDESSILKNFKGETKAEITRFMAKLPYRLLCTATAAPNDFIELGTSSEALGELGYIDMLSKFFKNDSNTTAIGGKGGKGRFDKNPFGAKFRFRGHAERDFWRWMCSWARAVRKPSDLGYDDGRFILPPMSTRMHTVKAKIPRDGFMFDLPAEGLQEQREERRRTINERCEMAASIIDQTSHPVVMWCHLNDESKLLTKLIRGAEEVCGDDSDDRKEEIFAGFADGSIRVIVTKSVIAGFGLNWQHCAHQVLFPSHSFEQYYQSIRRSWRFGQKRPVTVDIVASEGEESVMRNLQRKADAADTMFERLVSHMNNELKIQKVNNFTRKAEVPSWL